MGRYRTIIAIACFGSSADIAPREMAGDVQILNNTHEDEDLLRKYCTSFNSFITGSSYISELFRYLNRFWIKYCHCEEGQAPIPGVYTIAELAIHLWNEIVFSEIRCSIVKCIVQLYRRARKCSSISLDEISYIGNTVESFYTLGTCTSDIMSLYREELERPFLEDLTNYYFGLSNELLSQISVSKYLQEVETICASEQKRCDGKLHRTTVVKARQTCCQVLVGNHAEQLCNEAEKFLLDNAIDDLRRLFLLFSELPDDRSLIAYKNLLKKFIERCGLSVVRQYSHEDTAKNPEEFIDALVHVRKKYLAIITNAFGSHALMRTALDQACKVFANSHPRLPEVLAKYTHYLMTPKRKSKPCILSGFPDSINVEEALEMKIGNIGIVFCLIDDKDVFKKYYAKYLAKRLIQETSLSRDWEIVLIQKLRDICGYEFVSKLQKMLKDKILSEDISTSFSAWILEMQSQLSRENHDAGEAIALHHQISYHCDVLTAGAWPIKTSAIDERLALPSQLSMHQQLFQQYYKQRSSGRKLSDAHHLSHGVLQTRCFEKPYEFVLSFYQILIMLQYNETNVHAEMGLQDALHIPGKDLDQHMKGLLKIGILIKRQSDSGVLYVLNTEFQNRKVRVFALPNATIETPQPEKARRGEIEDDRKMALQAAIVRLLKTRRDVMFAQLEVELVQLLHNQFTPSTTMIKSNVEILLQKEFLKRHEEDHQRLLYIARFTKQLRRHSLDAIDSSSIYIDTLQISHHASIVSSSSYSKRAQKMEHASPRPPMSAKSKRRKNRIKINLSLCKYEVVKKVARARGWDIITEEHVRFSFAACNIHWIDVPEFCETFKRLQAFQRVNHFPGLSNVLARKSKLARNFERMKKLFPEEYDFCPRTWILPFDYHDFSQQFNQDGFSQRTFIVKPDHMCQGRGVFLTKQLHQLHRADILVAQHYVSRPLLIDDKKFDLRVYVLVTSCDPLRVYLFNDGLVRMCTADYMAPNEANMDQRFMHLTNYAVNKHSTNYEANMGIELSGEGSKRSVRWFFSWLRKKYEGVRVDQLWEQIGQICLKSILAVQPVLSQEYTSAFAKHGASSKMGSRNDRKAERCDAFTDGGDNNRPELDLTSGSDAEADQDKKFSNCFSILGMDVLVDESLKPWLLEVNHLPSFGCDSPVDWDVKERLISQVFDILSVSTNDRADWELRQARATQMRLYGGISTSSQNNSEDGQENLKLTRSDYDSESSGKKHTRNHNLLSHLQLHAALTRYYERFNADRLDDVEMLVEKFHDRQIALNASLVDKYGHGVPELQRRPTSSPSQCSVSSRGRSLQTICTDEKNIPLIDFVLLYPPPENFKGVEKYQEILDKAAKDVREQQMRFTSPLVHRRLDDDNSLLPFIKSGTKQFDQGRDCFGFSGTDKARYFAAFEKNKKPLALPNANQVAAAHRMMLGHSSQKFSVALPSSPSFSSKAEKEHVDYGLQYRERLAMAKSKPTLTMTQVTFDGFD